MIEVHLNDNNILSNCIMFIEGIDDDEDFAANNNNASCYELN